ITRVEQNDSPLPTKYLHPVNGSAHLTGRLFNCAFDRPCQNFNVALEIIIGENGWIEGNNCGFFEIRPKYFSDSLMALRLREPFFLKVFPLYNEFFDDVVSVFSF